MRKVVVFTNLTLDGVMQAPGRPEEDRRGKFEHGGWATPYAAMMEAGGILGDTGALLFGRRTYEDFFSFWPAQKDNPFTSVLDNTPKFVASRTLKGPLAWGARLLEGDLTESVGRMKAAHAGNLIVSGAGELARALVREHLVDEVWFTVYPYLWPSGPRVLDEVVATRLELISTETYASGVVQLCYRCACSGMPSDS